MGLLIVIGGFVIVVFSVIVNGVVLSQLWQWFIVTSLHAPALNIAQALGISLVVGYLSYDHAREHDKDLDNKSAGYKLAYGLLKSLIMGGLYLLFGLIIKSFLPAQ